MSDFEIDLSGRAALVTGGGAGRGRAIAIALAEAGAAVAIADLNIERADKVADAIRAAGGGAIPLHADVSNRFQVANMIERTRDAFGSIDILVNAATVFHAEPMLRVDEWNWRRQIEVNITGAFFCTQLVARVMADEGGGCILNLASTEGYESSLPAGIGYVAGGAGLIGLTRQAARELAQHQIRVNCIASAARVAGGGAPIPQPLAPTRREGEKDSAKPEVAVVDGAHPTAPDELRAKVAEAALFLCSDAAASISGRVIVAESGGWRDWLPSASG